MIWQLSAFPRLRLFSLFSAALTGALVSLSVSAAAEGAEACSDCQPAKLASCGGFLEGPVVDGDGSVWLVDVSAGVLKRIDREGHCATVTSSAGGPNGLAIGPDGLVYIANQSHGLLVFDPQRESTRVVASDYQGEPVKGANDLAFDAEGGLYLTVPQGDLFDPQGRLFYLPPGADELTLVAEGLSYPNGVAVSGDGERVLVAEMMLKRILAIPAVGKASPFNVTYVWARTVGGVGPDGIHLADDGRLYVANLARREVLVFAPDGMPQQSIRLPEQAGLLTTNVTSDGRHLYITESAQGEVWRVAVPATR